MVCQMKDSEISIEDQLAAARNQLNACNQVLPKLEPMLELQTIYKDRLVVRLDPEAPSMGTKLKAGLTKTLRKKEAKLAILQAKVVKLQKEQIEAMEAIGGLLNRQSAEKLAAEALPPPPAVVISAAPTASDG